MLKDKLAILMKNKEKGSLSPLEQKAKMGVLQGMKQMASDAMGDKLKGLKKVTVASSDPEGLEEGLEKAKQLVGSSDESSEEIPESEGLESEEEMEGPADEMSESPAHQKLEALMGTEEHLTPELIDQKIQELQALKESLKA